MPAANQLQCGFTLAHAAVARNQHAHAVYRYQNAVARYARSEAAVGVVDGGEEELRRHHSGLIDGDIARGGGFQQLFRRMHPAADDDAGNVEGEVLFEHLTAYFRFKVLQIRHFDLADDLWTLKWEIFIEAAELHTRTVQVGGADIPFRLRGRGQHRQLKRLGKVGCPCTIGNLLNTMQNQSKRIRWIYRATPSS